MDKLNNIGLCFETAVADQPSSDQPVIDVTKKRVVECLQQIGQHELAGILNKNQGKISQVATIQLSLPLTCVHKNGRSFEHSTDRSPFLIMSLYNCDCDGNSISVASR
jgi:hypothetical protein